MHVRPRLALVALAATAVFAAACSTLPQSVAARVGDVEIELSDLDELMGRSTVAYRLDRQELELARRAEEVGLLRRELLDQGLITLVNQGPDLDRTRLPLLDEDTVEQLYQDQVTALEGDVAELADEIGLTEAAYRDLFSEVAVAELAGLFQTGGAPFELEATGQVRTLQTQLLEQLINAEVTRVLFDELDLELDEATVDLQTDQLLAQFPTQDEALAVLALSGYTLDAFKELVVRTQLRSQQLQSVQAQDPAAAERVTEVVDGLDVAVAARFGDWNPQTRTIDVPTALDG